MAKKAYGTNKLYARKNVLKQWFSILKSTNRYYKNFEDRRGIGYQCFYTRDDVTAPWEKEFGIY